MKKANRPLFDFFPQFFMWGGATFIVLLAMFLFLKSWQNRSRGDIPELRYAEAIASQGRKREAIALYSAILERHRNNGNVYFLRGQAYVSEGRYEEAISDFSRSAELGYPETGSYLWRAVVYGRYLGQWSKEVDDASRALVRDPVSAEAYWVRSEGRMGLGDVPGAMKDISTAIEMSPSSSLFYSERAMMRLRARDFSGALLDADFAISASTGVPDGYFAKGSVYAAMGRHSSATRYFSYAIDRQPNAAEYFNARAYSRQQSGDMSGAASDYISALERSSASLSGFGEGMFLASQADFRAGNIDAAADEADKAVLFRPRQADYYILRGRIRHQLGKYKEAIEDFRAAMELAYWRSAEINGYIRESSRTENQSRGK